MSIKLLDYKNYMELVLGTSLGHEKTKTVVYFEGTRNAEGESWCPNCREAWPIFENVTKNYKKYYEFYRVEVGTREEFKKLDGKFQPVNIFRKSRIAKINRIPTIVIYGKYELARLIENECKDKGEIEKKLEGLKKEG